MSSLFISRDTMYTAAIIICAASVLLMSCSANRSTFRYDDKSGLEYARIGDKKLLSKIHTALKRAVQKEQYDIDTTSLIICDLYEASYCDDPRVLSTLESAFLGSLRSVKMQILDTAKYQSGLDVVSGYSAFIIKRGGSLVAYYKGCKDILIYKDTHFASDLGESLQAFYEMTQSKKVVWISLPKLYDMPCSADFIGNNNYSTMSHEQNVYISAPLWSLWTIDSNNTVNIYVWNANLRPTEVTYAEMFKNEATLHPSDIESYSLIPLLEYNYALQSLYHRSKWRIHAR